jgi:hypothetical protein
VTRKTKKKKKKKTIKLPHESDECPLEIRRPSRRNRTRLELPVGKTDLEALRSVTREWLAPLLVERFLRKQGIDLRACQNPSKSKFPSHG